MPKDKKLISVSFVTLSRSEYFTFIFCLAISLSCLFLNDNPQINRVRATVVDSWAGILKMISWYRSIGEMREELSSLRIRTSELMIENSQLRKSAIENFRLREMLDYQNKTSHTLIPAAVIARDQDNLVRSITVNVGQKQGVEKGMPVITPSGIVGKVVRAGENSAIVQILTDHNFRATCKIQRSRVNGILASSDGEISFLTQVPQNADVREGDLVVTSGYSHTFPPELRAGQVINVKAEVHSIFKTILVKPFVDIMRLEEVFIIKVFQRDDLPAEVEGDEQ